MAFPDLVFCLTSNGQEVFHLERGSLKQRIVQVLGNTYNARLVSVREETDYLNIYGFVGKPETAKKTRGDQYFFVNNRFIKSPYLNHAVMNAFSDMIARDSFPMYALFIDLDPSRLDVNVHPTKQEIKFEDEKLIYAFVQAAVKHALAHFSVSPTLDFDLDMAIQQTDAVSQPFTEDKKLAASSSSLYQTFSQKNQAHFIESKSNLAHWNDQGSFTNGNAVTPQEPAIENENDMRPGTGFKQVQNLKKPLNDVFIQLHNTYIIAEIDNGFIGIHQQNAHERVLYERFANAIKGKPIPVQRSLFPVTIGLAPGDAILLNDLLPDIQLLGFLVEPFGNNTFIIQGTPADVIQGDESITLEKILEQYKHFSTEVKFSKREKLLRSLAWQQSVKTGTSLTQKEMAGLIDDLFDCETPNTTPNGKPVYIEFKKEELDKMFGR